MADIGNKPYRRARFEVGDRVETGERGDDEYDIGTIVEVTFNGIRVHWERADEIFAESQEVVRPARPEAPPGSAMITDKQIRELWASGEIDLVQFRQATDVIVGWIDTDFQKARRAARARCAEILRARRSRDKIT